MNLANAKVGQLLIPVDAEFQDPFGNALALMEEVEVGGVAASVG